MRHLLLLAAALPSLALPAAGQTLPKRIAVWSLTLPRRLEEPTNVPGATRPEDVKSEFDSLITNILTAAGVSVVPVSETRAVWKRLVDSSGGFFDTYTGKRIEAKYQAVRAAWQQELATRLGAEAWLFPRVVTKSAKVHGTKVKWDGVEQESGAKSGGILKVLFGSDEEAQLGVLSLVVDIEDINGKVLYSGVGGIQLRSKIVYEHIEEIGMAGGLFVNTERNRRACHLALDPALK